MTFSLFDKWSVGDPLYFECRCNPACITALQAEVNLARATASASLIEAWMIDL
jgi:hypothetical protein